MVIKKIVFFCGTPFTKRDYDRFGGEILKENGFEVWFYDFSPIVYPELYNNCTYPDLYQPKNYVCFLDERQIKEYIGELSLINPEQIDGIASSIYAIADRIIRTECIGSIKAKVVIPTSETIWPHIRERLEKGF